MDICTLNWLVQKTDGNFTSITQWSSPLPGHYQRKGFLSFILIHLLVYIIHWSNMMLTLKREWNLHGSLHFINNLRHDQSCFWSRNWVTNVLPSCLKWILYPGVLIISFVLVLKRELGVVAWSSDFCTSKQYAGPDHVIGWWFSFFSTRVWGGWGCWLYLRWRRDDGWEIYEMKLKVLVCKSAFLMPYMVCKFHLYLTCRPTLFILFISTVTSIWSQLCFCQFIRSWGGKPMQQTNSSPANLELLLMFVYMTDMEFLEQFSHYDDKMWDGAGPSPACHYLCKMYSNKHLHARKVTL